MQDWSLVRVASEDRRGVAEAFRVVAEETNRRALGVQSLISVCFLGFRAKSSGFGRMIVQFTEQ